MAKGERDIIFRDWQVKQRQKTAAAPWVYPDQKPHITWRSVLSYTTPITTRETPFVLRYANGLCYFVLGAMATIPCVCSSGRKLVLLVCDVGVIGALPLNCVRLPVYRLDNEHPRWVVTVRRVLDTVSNLEGL